MRLAALVLAGMMAACSEPADVDRLDGAAPEPVQEITLDEDDVIDIDDYVAAYAENEAAAEARFNTLVVVVEATIESIDLDMDDEPVIRLQADILPAPVVRLSEENWEQAIDLAKGQRAIFLCANVSEFLGSPRFDDCQHLRTSDLAAG